MVHFWNYIFRDFIFELSISKRLNLSIYFKGCLILDLSWFQRCCLYSLVCSLKEPMTASIEKQSSCKRSLQCWGHNLGKHQSVVDPRWGNRDALGPNFFYFHAVFCNNFCQKNKLTPRSETPSKKSLFCHSQCRYGVPCLKNRGISKIVSKPTWVSKSRKWGDNLQTTFHQ